ncbi:sulfurtransferase [Leifsonia shinshuensis]|uniref:Sulfurtransferase n=1 Tax=Leifsonia shinshuensis TaxID=150026 RepID=A0A7G6YFY6_9MICO|nr:rhodanese-like domain-containing protein [Leifsonia shinshuensis]QNE37401.1 sulfurtransferase [Leifsonia shinshuensis]
MTLTTARSDEPTVPDPATLADLRGDRRNGADDSSAGVEVRAALGAALAGPLVSTQWLCDHLGADGLLVIDASVVAVAGADGRTDYVSGIERHGEGHVPGAVFADLLERFSDPAAPFPFTRPGAEAFAAAATALGVDADTTVVVYDGAVGQWASRLWWLFRSFGHDRVAVLDGGVTKWREEGRPLASGPVTPAPAGRFVAAELPGFWSDREDVAALLAGDRPGTLVCGTAPKDFAARHIPGSVSAPAVRLVDRATNAFLPAAGLHDLFADVLASPDPIVAYCGGGIAAAADALALALLGRDDVTVYDGSLNEWASDPAAPLARA